MPDNAAKNPNPPPHIEEVLSAFQHFGSTSIRAMGYSQKRYAEIMTPAIAEIRAFCELHDFRINWGDPT